MCTIFKTDNLINVILIFVIFVIFQECVFSYQQTRHVMLQKITFITKIKITKINFCMSLGVN